MPFIGNKPSAVPLTSADITDGIITSAKIVDGTIVNADINASAAIASTKLSGVQGKFESALLHVRDEKSANTGGGTFTSGAFQTRTLNTSVTNEISGASLSSNQITLPSGTYYIEASAPAFAVTRHKAKLRNTTDSSDTLIGTSEITYNLDSTVSTCSFVTGRFTIAAQKTFELQHRCENTKTTDGFGIENNFSVVEVFADVQIWKVA
jgi:hypothetical protein